MLLNEGATPGAILSATPGSTPRQRPGNGGAIYTPYTPSVAPALSGGVHAEDLADDLVPMPGVWERGAHAERAVPFALPKKSGEAI